MIEMPNGWSEKKTISKMSPDPSALHIPGSDRKLKKVRKPKYPEATRKIGCTTEDK